MPGEVDPRLVNFLRASMSFMDALHDIGADGVAVTLDRKAGMSLLQLATCANNLKAEEWSQRDRPRRDGMNTLAIAGLTFEWPKPIADRVSVNGKPGIAANDNGRVTATRVAYEDEAPGQR